jgi:uncharacterized protein YwqG
MTLDQKYSATIDRLNKYKKTTYLPKVVLSQNTFSHKSKFGGFPYLRNEKDWETCPTCNKQMEMFLQLNTNEIPEIEFRKDCVIQIFYCREDFESLSRLIEIEGESKKVKCDIINLLQEKQILEWQKSIDYPHHEEHWNLDKEIDIEDEVDWLMEERNEGLCIRKDKLFGWPYWEQDERYPKDENTGENMELLFQFVSNDNLPYSFGDDGIIQIFINKKMEFTAAFNCS